MVHFICGPVYWVSELLLLNANSAIFQLYHGENKLMFNKMMMRSALFYTNTLRWMLIVLAHWNNSPRVDMSLHSDTLFWFQPVFALSPLLLRTYRISKIYHFHSLWPARPELEPRSTAPEASTLTITPSMRFLFIETLFKGTDFYQARYL